MIDLHNHILPGIDDGARDADESRALCAHFAAAGYTGLCFTPHIRPTLFDNNEEDLRARFTALKAELGDLASRFTLHLGAEYYYDAGLATNFASGARKPLTLDPLGKYVLLEFDGLSRPPTLREAVFRLKMAGLTPVMAHPERYAFVASDLDYVEGLVDAGLVLQGTLRPIIGLWGHAARRTLKKLLAARLVHVISSDIHREREAERVLREGRRVLTSLVGASRAETLLLHNPARILAGEPLDAPG